MANELSNRADIDGLRAIVVLAVIASHLPEKFLPSGILSIDVFFVVFKLFDSVCPANDTYFYPDNGSNFLYRYKDHFNSLGSKFLAGPFAELLRSSGTLAPSK